MTCKWLILSVWFLLCSAANAAEDATGSWVGDIAGHPVEIALLKGGSGSQVGYLYAPADDCFSSVKVERDRDLFDDGGVVLFYRLVIGHVQPYQPGKSCGSDDRGAFGRITATTGNSISIEFEKFQLLSTYTRSMPVTLSKAKGNAISNPMKKMFQRGMRTLNISESNLSAFGSPEAGNRGIIDRSDAYWANYKTGSFRQIFDGNFGNAKIHRDFAHVYVSYQGFFSSQCKQYIRDGHSLTTIKYTYRGNQLISQEETGTIFIRQAFWEKYPIYKELIGDVLARNTYEALFSLSLKDMWRVASGITQDVINVNTDLNRMFDIEGCDSGFQRQFSENLRRLGYGEVVLQKDHGKVFDYTKNDITKGIADKPTIESVCYKHYTARGGIDRDDQRAEWCNCLGKGLRANLSQSELELAMNDFASVDRKFDAQPKGDDPRWRYINVRNSCIRR